jgi:hypothetical protein
MAARSEHRVAAVFHHRAQAERAAQSLERLRLGDDIHVTLEDRRMTDDPPDEPPAAAVEDFEYERDREVAGHVFRTTATLSILYAFAGALVGGGAGWAIWGWSTTGFWIALVVGAVTGTVLGAMQGGIAAAMDESEKEEGTVLIAETQDPRSARFVEEALQRHGPARIDTSEDRGRLAG